jgi:WD40 repeat protein
MSHKIALPRSQDLHEPQQKASPIVRTLGELRFRTDGDVLGLAFSGDGCLWSLEEPGVLRQWDVLTGKAIKSAFLSDLDTLWAFSDDGLLIASASDEVILWDVATGEMLTLLQQSSWVTAVALRSSEAMLASGHDDGVVRLWDVGEEQVVREFKGHDRAIGALAFSPDGKRLATAGEDRLIAVWDVQTGRRLGTLNRHTDRIGALTWHPNGRVLVSAAWDRTARVWDTTSFEPVILLNSHADQVTALAFSPDGSRLASADSGNAVRLWDAAAGKEEAVLEGHSDQIHALAFSPGNRVLASAGADRAIRLWDIDRGRPLHGAGSPVHDRVLLAIGPGGDWLASTCGGQGIHLWETASGKQRFILDAAGPTQFLAGSADGKWLACGGEDNRIEVRDAQTGELLRTLEGPTGDLAALEFAPDCQTLASAHAADGSVWLWSVLTGEALLVIPLAAAGCSVQALAFHPEGHLLAAGGVDWLATGGSEGAVCLWNVKERSRAATIRRSARALAFDSTGQRLASASLDDSIWVWDVPVERLVFEVTGHTNRVNAVSYSPNGKWLASGSDDRTTRLWTAQTGQLWAVHEFETAIRALAFSSDNRFLFTGNGNTTSYQLEMRILVEAGLRSPTGGVVSARPIGD